MVLGAFPDVCVVDVGRSIEFYRALLHLDVLLDHGWYAELGADGRTLIALVEAGHESIPSAVGAIPRGVLISFEVDDAASAFSDAMRLGCVALVELATELGQRHFMVADPDGAVVDVIERVALTAEDLRRLVRLRRLHVVRSATCH